MTRTERRASSLTVIDPAGPAAPITDLPGPSSRPSRQPAPARAGVSRWLPDPALLAGPVVTLAVMLWGVGAQSYWGDEADTVSAVSRTLPQLIQLLGHIDAVHGLYYLLLWPVARIFGTGQFVTRLPSAVAMAAAAAGISAIARRLASRRAAVWSGLIFAALPVVTSQGHDARPYAAVTAAAVLASYLLIRVVADPRPGLLASYGLVLVLIGYLQLFGFLLVVAHAVALIGLGRRPGRTGGSPLAVLVRRWLVTTVAACLVVVPVAVIGWAQRAQIAWIPKPGWGDAWNVVTTLTADSAAVAVLIWLLAALGCVYGSGPAAAGRRTALVLARPAADAADRVPHPDRLPRPAPLDRSLPWLALPWLVLPPLILLAASEIKPVYWDRYITFCLPAVALLAGAGLAALRLPVRAAALALIVALVAPTQLALRTPGGGMEAAATFLTTHEQPGDAIVWPQSLVPPWYLAYPDGFDQLRDLSLSKSPGASGRLYGDTVSLPVLLQREQSVSRIWVVPVQGSRNPADYLAPGFTLAHKWNIKGQTVLLYTRTVNPG